jgi:hypothetical protein
MANVQLATKVLNHIRKNWDQTHLLVSLKLIQKVWSLILAAEIRCYDEW